MDDNFDFLEEKIKKQNPYKKWLKRAGEALFSGVIIAAVVLVILLFVYPRLNGAINGNTESQVSLQDANVSSGIVQSEAVSVSGIPESQSSVVEESAAGETDKKDADQEDADPKDADQDDSDTEDSKDEEASGEEQSISAKENMLAASADIVDITKAVKKSMVTVIGITEDKDWFNQTYENQGQLSGLIIAKKGKVYYILTEYRVVKDVNRIRVTFFDGSSSDARFIRRDPATNLAVIRVDAADVPESTRKKIQPADIEHYTAVSQGETVIAMGSPMGYSDSIACGMVTSVGNSVNVTDNAYNVLCTDIPASQEGSGILVDLDGNVVGIMAQKLTDTKEIGLMSCLPVSEILSQVERLCNDKKSVYLGVEGQEVTTSVSGATGIPKGIYVNNVKKDSPAMVTGIQAGDVITKINISEVYTLKAFHSVLEEAGIGRKVTVHAMRQSTEGYVEMTFEMEIEGR